MRNIPMFSISFPNESFFTMSPNPNKYFCQDKVWSNIKKPRWDCQFLKTVIHFFEVISKLLYSLKP